MTDPISAIIAAANFVFSSSNLIAQTIRFVGSTLLSAALNSSKQPRLSDLKIQTSAYGAPIPRLYGTSVRVAGNLIDKSDLIPIRHKKGAIFGIGGVKYFTYDAHVAVLICEGPQNQGSLKRIWADGKLFFDRDATDATPGTVTAEGGTQWSRTNKTHSKADTITFYPGSATQGVDPTLQALHDGVDLPGYRFSTYVVIKRVTTSDFGNRVPNFEFEIEPSLTVLGEIVEDLASFADVSVYGSRLTETVRGLVIANDGSCWDAIEPLAGAFAFDLIAKPNRFEAVKRGRYVRTLIDDKNTGARKAGETLNSIKDVSIEDANKYPDEVTITYFDIERDYQPNTQRAFRNEGFSRNKLNVEVPIVMTADEARNLAQRTLMEGQAAARTMKRSVSEKYRWLEAGDVVGFTVGGFIEPFRITTVTRSPSGVIDLEVTWEDPYLYIGDLTGSAGNFPVNELALPGDTIMQPIDGAIVQDKDDDTGFYGTFAGTGSGWRGAEIYRALGIGSPLIFEVIGNVGIAATIADVDTTLADGPTDVWDYVNTVTVTLLTPGATLSSVTQDDVVTLNANLAWIGAANGEGGEYINFATATAGSPDGVYVLSDLLRGRYGTEYATGSHGSGERFVLMTDLDAIYRLDFGAIDWNLARTYMAASLPEDTGLEIEFTNSGEGKRPLAPIHLTADRFASPVDDILIRWTRRTRYKPPALGGGAVPLGEEVEAYEIDVYGGSPLAVVRTLTATEPQVNYTEAMQVTDGHAVGDPVTVSVYQMSGVYGRGRGATAEV